MIQEVIEALESREWLRGELMEWSHEDGRVWGCCLLGAIRIAAHEQGGSIAEIDKRTRTVCRKIHERVGSNVPHYNDKIARSKEEIIEMLRSIE